MDEYLGSFTVRLLENKASLLTGKVKLSVPLSLLCMLDNDYSDPVYENAYPSLNSKLEIIRSMLRQCRKVKLIHNGLASPLSVLDAAQFLSSASYLELCRLRISDLQSFARLRNHLQVLVLVDCDCDTPAALLDNSRMHNNRYGNYTRRTNTDSNFEGDGWKFLKALFLVGCELSSLDDGLRLCPALDVLNLRRNELASCEEYLVPLTNLASLDASYNRLVRFPCLAIPARLSMQTLILRHNCLDDESVMPALAALINLRYLDLAWNFIVQIPTLRCLRRCLFLRHLYLEGNPLCAVKLPAAGVVFDYRVVVAAHTYKPSVAALKIDGKSLNRRELEEANSLIITEVDYETEPVPDLDAVNKEDDSTLNDFGSDVYTPDEFSPLCTGPIDYSVLSERRKKLSDSQSVNADLFGSSEQYHNASGSNEMTKSMRSSDGVHPPEMSQPVVPVKRNSIPKATVTVAASARRPPVALVENSLPRKAVIIDRFESNVESLDEKLEQLTRAQSGASRTPRNVELPQQHVAHKNSVATQPITTYADVVSNSTGPKKIVTAAAHERVTKLTVEMRSADQHAAVPESAKNPPQSTQQPRSNSNAIDADTDKPVMTKLEADSDEKPPFHVVVLEPVDLAAFNPRLAHELASRGTIATNGNSKLELFVSVGGRHIIERTLNQTVVELLELDALVDVKQDRGDERRVLIKLSYQRPDRQIRHYLVESEDSALELFCLLEPYLLTKSAGGAISSSMVNERGSRHEAEGDVLPSKKCMSCSLTFNRDAAKRKYERMTHRGDISPGPSGNMREVFVCPQCGSSQLAEVRGDADGVSKQNVAKRAVGNLFGRARRGNLFSNNKLSTVISSSSTITTALVQPPLTQSEIPSTYLSTSTSVQTTNIAANEAESFDTTVESSIVPVTMRTKAEKKAHAPLKRLAMLVNNDDLIAEEEAHSTASTADGNTESEVSLLTNPSESDVRILDDEADVHSTGTTGDQNDIESDADNSDAGNRPICMSTASSATVVAAESDANLGFLENRRNSSAVSLSVLRSDDEQQQSSAPTGKITAVSAGSSSANIQSGLDENTASSSAETLADPDEALLRIVTRLREANEESANFIDSDDADDIIKFFPDEPTQIDPRLLKFITSHVFKAADITADVGREHCLAVCQCDLLCDASLHTDLSRGGTLASYNTGEQRRQSSAMTKSDLILPSSKRANWMSTSVSSATARDFTELHSNSSTSSSMVNDATTSSAFGINDAVIVFSTYRVYILRRSDTTSGNADYQQSYWSAYNIANELQVLHSWPLVALAVPQKKDVSPVAAVERALKGQCLLLKLPIAAAETTSRRVWRRKRSSLSNPVSGCCLLMTADQKRCAKLVNIFLDNSSFTVEENVGSIFSPSRPITDKNFHSSWVKTAILSNYETTHDAERDVNGNVLFMTLCKLSNYSLNKQDSNVCGWICLAITSTHLVLVKRLSQLASENLFVFSNSAPDAANADSSDTGKNLAMTSSSENNAIAPSLSVKAHSEVTSIIFSLTKSLTIKIVFDRDECWLLDFVTVDTVEAVVGVIRTNWERIYQVALPIELVHDK